MPPGDCWPLRAARSRRIVESAEAAGLGRLDPLAAPRPLETTTFGVGELILDAVGHGARRVVVGCGGSATTDGGWGALQAVGGADRLNGAELVVACDVTIPFLDAPARFGPQKGAAPDDIVHLEQRLDRLAEHYQAHFGVDPRPVAGSGAAGGLAGGLLAIGGRLTGGFDLVAELVGLRRRLARADLVMTGEGRLDAGSFEGKVVGGVLRLADGRAPVLVVVGQRAPDLPPELLTREGSPTVVALADDAGPDAARRDVLELVETAVLRALGDTPAAKP